MLSFKAQGGAEFGFVTDFSAHEYANMSFFASNQQDILFHLSLRKSIDKAVVNLRKDGVWGREIMHDVTLAATGDTVVIQIDDAQVSIRVNDHDVCLYNGDFPALDTIRFVNFNGGIDETSVLIEGAANNARTGEGEMQLTGFLDVEGWAVDPALPHQDITLVVDGIEEPLALSRVARPNIARTYRQMDDHVGIFTSLPGRIWDGARAAQDSVSVSALSNGIVCGAPLDVTRAMVQQRIETLCAADHQSTYDILLATEHVRFGQLWDTLSDHARETLGQAAKLYGVFEYMMRADLDASDTDAAQHFAPAGGAADIHPNQMLLRTAQSKFGTLFADRSPDTSPVTLFQQVIEEFPLPPDVEKFLILSLTEAFCETGCFEQFYAFVSPRLAKPFELGNTTWHNSCAAPFLLMDGRFYDLKEMLWALADATEGWVVTPALAWTIRTVLAQRGQHADEKALEDIIYAYKTFIERRSGNYWDRTQCRALTQTAVSMIVHSERFADYLRDEIPGFVLQHYGLSRTFWQLLLERAEKENIPLSPHMRRAYTAFQKLEQATPGDAAVIAAGLHPFEQIGHPETPRYLRELINPGAFAKTAAAFETALSTQGSNSDDLLVRTLAAPGVQDNFGDAYAGQTRRAVQQLYKTVPRAPHLGIQERLGQNLQRLARQEPVNLNHVMDDLTRVAVERAGYLGMGLALRMVPMFETLGQTAQAMRVMSHVGELRAIIPVEQHQAMFDSSAVQSSLSALKAMASDQMPITRSCLKLFPNFAGQKRTVTGLGSITETGHPLTPLYSTLVVIFSCQAYLDTRVEAMRQGWLSKLQDMGVPYVVVVGDGDGTQDGDVVYLEAPDDYEGLPAKTLAALDWALTHTDATHIYKIDDDCLLDPETFFGTLSYLKYDYYGRVIRRHVGGMNRTWHFSKSRSDRGIKELDKSPEPSVYCDGGSGYLLSRRAMRSIQRAARRLEGQQIVRAAFMEDKLVGDLLALEGIAPSNEDYRIAVQRRTHADAVPVSRWENSFHPSPLSGTSLVHLDTHVTQKEVFDARSTSRLWPRKIWPTYKAIALGDGTNALELVSDEAKLARLNAEPLAAVACMRNEMFMLPHFLAHYRKLGVKAFLIADNCSDDGTLEYLLDQPDVVTFSVDTDYGQSQYGVAWQMAMIANLRLGRWSVIVDADELLVYKNWKKTSLPKLLAGKSFQDADAARIYMLDMYPEGPLSAADFSSGDPFKEAGFVEREPFLRESVGRGPFSNSRTVTSALRHRLLPWSRPELFVAQKYALLKYQPWMRPSAGFHYVGDINVSETEMIFAHFKYTAQFRQKALDEVARGQHFNNAEEYRKYLALMSEGREVIHDPDVSVPWESCDEVKRILS